MKFADIASTASKAAKNERGFDIDKRAETADMPEKNYEKSFDIDKRADVTMKNDISSVSDSEFNIDKRADDRIDSNDNVYKTESDYQNEIKETDGGSYKEVHNAHKEDETKETHYMPVDSASELDTADGPCIIMDKSDYLNEIKETDGGSYKEVHNAHKGDETKETHHMPADSVSELDTNDGPCIIMDKEDHMQTASWGNSKEARAYKELQREYIKEGKFREALQMDIDDIREKFGDKYDKAIDQMLSYVDKLEAEGKIRC